MKRTRYIISFYTLLLILFVINISNAQATWKSEKFNYSLEIPINFFVQKAIGTNVDFKAVSDLSSIVVVIKVFPQPFVKYSIWDTLGELETFGEEWEIGANEYMDNPKFIKYGKTIISNYNAFWYDYTSNNPKFYSKTYQIKTRDLLYTITLTCPADKLGNYSAKWYRFKERIILD